MLDHALLAEARSLLAAAMPAPWTIHPHLDSWEVRDGEDVLRADRCGRSDAELIVWARNNLPVLLDELEAARRSLAAIKVADPDLFDPRGGTSRGAAYETYGSPGHHLRGKYLAAIGVTLEEADDDD